MPKKQPASFQKLIPFCSNFMAGYKFINATNLIL
jgi:hypothetical protein